MVFEIETSFTKERSFFSKASVSGNILGFFFVFTNSLHLFCLSPTVLSRNATSHLRLRIRNFCFALWLGEALVFVFAITLWGCGLVFFMTDLLEGALSSFRKKSCFIFYGQRPLQRENLKCYRNFVQTYGQRDLAI